MEVSFNIPLPRQKEVLFSKNATTGDIVRGVLEAYRNNRLQLKAFSVHMRADTIRQTCFNIWRFIRKNIHYQVDPDNQQWVRTPPRLWADGEGDCKSFAVFAASCLYCLNINGVIRFVSYDSDPEPTHVYVVVKGSNGKEIILDAVLDEFNREKPYTFKHDYAMTEVKILSGVGARQYGSPRIEREDEEAIIGGIFDDEIPQVSGFFDGLLGINKQHRDKWKASLPSVCMAYLYAVGISDAQALNLPPAMKAKRQAQIDSMRFMDDKADGSYDMPEITADLVNAITAKNNGQSPQQLMAPLLSALSPVKISGTRVGDANSSFYPFLSNAAAGATPPATTPPPFNWGGYAGQIFTGTANTGGTFGGSLVSAAASVPSPVQPYAAVAQTIGTFAANIFGKYGQWGFEFPASLDPAAITPDPKDFEGYIRQPQQAGGQTNGAGSSGSNSSSSDNTIWWVLGGAAAVGIGLTLMRKKKRA